ncbi:lipopolysaccharide biosynthesis protein [Micromonospora sp. NPDC000207]|uniref:lipopolysaccharide biosynthesis protein n=1 Tax=Micromonospora sp. NPDC000207 TaxID=3154246 RepID=UPI0033289145
MTGAATGTVEAGAAPSSGGGPPEPAGVGRTRRLATGIVSSLAGRAVGLVAPLVVTPLTFGYLGAERYGLWMAVTSLTGMALFADLGLGNGLLTRLSRLHGTGDRPAAAREVSSAYAVLGALTAGLLVLLAVAGVTVPWADLFAVTDPRVAAGAPAVALVCLGAFLVNVPLALVQRIQYAHQEVTRSNLWQAAGSLSSVVLVGVAVAARVDPVLVVAVAVGAVPATNLVNTVAYFAGRGRDLRPRRRLVDRRVARNLLRLGAAFCALSVLTSAALNVDAFLVGRVLGLTEAAVYAVVLRLFALLGLFVTVVNLPLWPANGEAIARGDVRWVRRSTRRMVLVSVGAVTLPGVALVVAGNPLLDWWLRDPLFPTVPVALLAALAGWSVLVAAAAPLFMAQNAVSLLGPQFFGWAGFLAVSVPAKVLLAEGYGLTGVAVATTAGYALTVLPAAVVGYRRTLSAVATGTTAVATGTREAVVGGERRPDDAD